MYFKKLEIFGFKSFADKTTLCFEPGITAIIGPNGCGKSNVFDAIRWVLGEQSMKELRGSTKEDVIFNGTDKKPALGFAEVSLTFSNESKMLPVEYDEVTVTRRLFRSGESEYLLNKTPVRLKDISEMFMGTGIGAEAYSMVQQGKVDLVVSAKPEDRRLILDEASGITKYKSKKKEALNKLRDTESNLLRINDIVVEVKRQISSLERQANKARKYKDEFEKLKKLEVKSARVDLSQYAIQRNQLKGRLQELKLNEKKLVEELKEFNDLVEHESNLLEEIEEKITETKEEDIKLEGKIDINNKQVGFHEERIETININKMRLKENKEQLIEKCRTQKNKIEEVSKAVASLDETMQQNLQALGNKKDTLGSITRSVEDTKIAIQKEEERILGITSSQVHIKNKLTEIMKEIQGSLARKRRLHMENTKVTNEKEEVDNRLNEISKKIENSIARVNNLRTELNSKIKTLDGQRSQLASIDLNIDELEKKKLFLKSQKEFIEKLAVQYKDIPDPIVEGRLFTDKPPLDHHTGIIGKVKEVLPMENSQMHDHLMSGFSGDAKQLYEIICETKFIELDPQQITAHIDELNHQIREQLVKRENLLAQIEEQKVTVGQFEKDAKEQERALSIYEAQKKDVAEESAKLKEELDLVEIELSETVELLNDLKKKEDELVYQLDTLNQDLVSSQTSIKERQEWITAKAKDREEVTVVIAQLETEIATVEEIRQSHTDNLKMFAETMDSHLEEMKRIDEEVKDIQINQEKYKKEIDELQEKIVEIKEQKVSLGEVLLEYEKQKDDLSQRINSVKSNMSSYGGDIDSIRQDLHNHEMLEQEIVFKEKEIKDRLLQAYRIDFDALEAEKTEQAPQEQGESFKEENLQGEELDAAIERLRKRCDSFGSVNLVAIEEFDELRERFEFLTKQQSDLITAKESLHKTITKINRDTRQMFMDTFTKVSEEFRIYFRMLFGGGEAQLVLLDPENVLESGIDIVARPPGKKLQNISLLSGEEKTLTAIALVFGVFKVNPSPFCVLDEIDAALDESNVGRFSYLLKDFAQIAQFIVITHNKKTMTHADVLYGITMQETGVSKVVSVKFGEDDSPQEIQEEVPVGV